MLDAGVRVSSPLASDGIITYPLDYNYETGEELAPASLTIVRGSLDVGLPLTGSPVTPDARGIKLLDGSTAVLRESAVTVRASSNWVAPVSAVAPQPGSSVTLLDTDLAAFVGANNQAVHTLSVPADATAIVRGGSIAATGRNDAVAVQTTQGNGGNTGRIEIRGVDIRSHATQGQGVGVLHDNDVTIRLVDSAVEARGHGAAVGVRIQQGTGQMRGTSVDAFDLNGGEGATAVLVGNVSTPFSITSSSLNAPDGTALMATAATVTGSDLRGGSAVNFGNTYSADVTIRSSELVGTSAGVGRINNYNNNYGTGQVRLFGSTLQGPIAVANNATLRADSSEVLGQLEGSSTFRNSVVESWQQANTCFFSVNTNDEELDRDCNLVQVNDPNDPYNP